MIDLKQKGGGKYMTQAAQAAAAIRKELKIAFPEIKFSVRSDNFSMGDSVSIRYNNGVPTEQVNAITKKYQYGSFNGMEDIYENTNNRDDIPQSKYVIVERNLTEDVKAEVKVKIAKEYGIADIDNESEWMKRTGQWSYEKVYRELQGQTL